ncbi:hypothetical protein CIT26_29240 [Mesorhizobium temperatum]|uniref:Uncharacterized protein n=1 Tax=Mesorhizobium temperatum TaxID=241416 RepID=A0A271LC39_9HYPH|nr:hypothetical protein CIT26_29240 [Mesorhizobium temperatum]
MVIDKIDQNVPPISDTSSPTGNKAASSNDLGRLCRADGKKRAHEAPFIFRSAIKQAAFAFRYQKR